MEELKPCPFCGGEAKFETYGGTTCAVVCQSCHCGTPTMSLVDGMAAVNRWNRRAERTCYPVLEDETMVCSECGEDIDGYGWNYCPNCGAKVVDE